MASNILKSFWGGGGFSCILILKSISPPTSQLPPVEDDPIGRIGCGLETPEVWETLRGCPWREQSVADWDVTSEGTIFSQVGVGFVLDPWKLNSENHWSEKKRNLQIFGTWRCGNWDDPEIFWKAWISLFRDVMYGDVQKLILWEG